VAPYLLIHKTLFSHTCFLRALCASSSGPSVLNSFLSFFFTNRTESECTSLDF
jgi:hypothetical protein